MEEPFRRRDELQDFRFLDWPHFLLLFLVDLDRWLRDRWLRDRRRPDCRRRDLRLGERRLRDLRFCDRRPRPLERLEFLD